MTIGERIKKIRKDANVTQQQFADRLDLKRNTIGNYEVDIIVPSERTIKAICAAYNVNPDWLISGIGEPYREISEKQKINDFVATITADESASFQRAMIEVLSDLTPQEWKLLEKFAERIANKKGNA